MLIEATEAIEAREATEAREAIEAKEAREVLNKTDTKSRTSATSSTTKNTPTSHQPEEASEETEVNEDAAVEAEEIAEMKADSTTMVLLETTIDRTTTETTNLNKERDLSAIQIRETDQSEEADSHQAAATTFMSDQEAEGVESQWKCIMMLQDTNIDLTIGTHPQLEEEEDTMTSIMINNNTTDNKLTCITGHQDNSTDLHPQ